jgi:tetratricopeptide (TPR) repeat protein
MAPANRSTSHPGWRTLRAACRGLILAGAFASPLHAADDARLLFIRGQSLAVEGRCEDALPLLAQARLADLRGTDASLLAGECLIQLERYDEAVEALEEARQRDASVELAELRLAMAYYHEGRFRAAERVLEAASARLSGRPEFHLYRGLLLLQRDEARSAARELEAARRAGPERVEPAASYYAGVAWASAGDLDRAERAFERVREEAPESPWAARATNVQGRVQAFRRSDLWLEIKTGLEYDDNVVLRAGAVSLPHSLPSQRDSRAVVEIEAGSEFFDDGAWSAGTMLSYRGQAHRDLGEFDLFYPAWTLWLDRRLAEGTAARLRYDVAYAGYDGDPFLFSQSLTPTLFQEWGDGSLTRFFARYYRLNYLGSNYDVAGAPSGSSPGDLCDPSGANPPPASTPACGPPGFNESSARNQDGNGITLGAEHRIPLGFANSELRGGYSFHHFGARGSEYSFNGHELSLGTLSALPFDFQLDTFASYTFLPYRHASSFVDPRDLQPGRQYPLDGSDRRDDIWRFEVELERPLSQRLLASVRYQYIRNQSNVTVFDYDRQILGAYLTVRFHR